MHFFLNSKGKRRKGDVDVSGLNPHLDSTTATPRFSLRFLPSLPTRTDTRYRHKGGRAVSLKCLISDLRALRQMVQTKHTPCIPTGALPQMDKNTKTHRECELDGPLGSII